MQPLSAIVAVGLAASACNESEPSWAATERAFWAYLAEHYRVSLGDANLAAAIDALQEGWLSPSANSSGPLCWTRTPSTPLERPVNAPVSPRRALTATVQSLPTLGAGARC